MAVSTALAYILQAKTGWGSPAPAVSQLPPWAGSACELLLSVCGLLLPSRDLGTESK